MEDKWLKGNELKYLKEVLENKKETKNNPFCDRLEEIFCKTYGSKYAVAVNSGTSALHAMLVAAGVGPGDEVITTPFTVLVDASMPIFLGAKPVFADVDYFTHNINPNSIEERITKKTKAVIAVSYHGTPYDIDAVKKICDEYGLVMIEDDAQAHLAEYKGRFVGKDADMTMFSLERTKHVSCGEGGVVITNDEGCAESVRKFSGMGFKTLKAKKGDLSAVTPLSYQHPNYKRHDCLGLNYRLPEFCAAVALAQMERVKEIVKIRRDIAKLYNDIFKNTSFEPQRIPTDCVSSYFTYSVKSPFNIKEWEEFYKLHIKNGGDDFYAGMALSYTEPALARLGYYIDWKGKCGTAEYIQPKIMQFKTNYSNIEEASKYIIKLKESIELYCDNNEKDVRFIK